VGLEPTSYKKLLTSIPKAPSHAKDRNKNPEGKDTLPSAALKFCSDVHLRITPMSCRSCHCPGQNWHPIHEAKAGKQTAMWLRLEQPWTSVSKFTRVQQPCQAKTVMVQAKTVIRHIRQHLDSTRQFNFALSSLKQLFQRSLGFNGRSKQNHQAPGQNCHLIHKAASGFHRAVQLCLEQPWQVVSKFTWVQQWSTVMTSKHCHGPGQNCHPIYKAEAGIQKGTTTSPWAALKITSKFTWGENPCEVKMR
jgi:hypothetical protein